MDISIIVPVYNEAVHIGSLVALLLKHQSGYMIEVIVADGGSTDETVQSARRAGAVVVECPEQGRSAQMNYGASKSSGNLLYFVHADTKPPVSYAQDIMNATQEGFELGRYQTKFDSKSLLLKLNAWFTRFDLFMCYGGDQTLFITRLLFEKLAGFKADMLIMEEYELVSRARNYAKYKIMRGKVFISARKYEKNSWFEVQQANYTMIKMYKRHLPQATLKAYYKNQLK